jgi:hypothetical protein
VIQKGLARGNTHPECSGTIPQAGGMDGLKRGKGESSSVGNLSLCAKM